ncbi:hypothetical protein BDV96DRAFT_653295 [Lophiotrema nucula]|uniref:EthD domain-containing protein n=1 Tax=Lophiotrema nucula TaxID=690887 RepID=A0A6A5YPF7_9PLEO|nr:hypothetical protein BDV96DRAFT_653295 [Lophiotrema nucula]
MSSPITAIVAYPTKHSETGESIKFDLNYYTSTHMPLINPSPLTGQPQPYHLQAVVKFKSLDGFKNALEKEGPVTKPDVEKFSNIFPVVWVAEPVPGGEQTVAGLESDGTAQV